MPDLTSLLSNFLTQLYNGTWTSGITTLGLANGTVAAPALAFQSEPTLGFYRSSAAVVTLNGDLNLGVGGATGKTLRASTVLMPVSQFSIAWAAGGYFGPASNAVFVMGNSAGNAGTNFDVSIDGVLKLKNLGRTAGAAVELLEQVAPGVGPANTVRLYAEDNGSGKTKLMAQFPTGAAVQVAIEL